MAKKKLRRDTIWMAKRKDENILCCSSASRERYIVENWIALFTDPNSYTIVRVGELKPRRRK